MKKFKFLTMAFAALFLSAAFTGCKDDDDDDKDAPSAITDSMGKSAAQAAANYSGIDASKFGVPAGCQYFDSEVDNDSEEPGVELEFKVTSDFSKSSLQKYVQQLFDASKKAAKGGKVYAYDDDSDDYYTKPISNLSECYWEGSDEDGNGYAWDWEYENSNGDYVNVYVEYDNDKEYGEYVSVTVEVEK